MIDGVEMNVERVETTHSLLRDAKDRTRWIANELLTTYPPARTGLPSLRAGQAVLFYGPTACGKTYLAEKLAAHHERYHLPKVLYADATANKDGYAVQEWTTAWIEGHLRAGGIFIVCVLDQPTDNMPALVFDVIVEFPGPPGTFRVSHNPLMP